jgi:hypothetical protein
MRKRVKKVATVQFRKRILGTPGESLLADTSPLKERSHGMVVTDSFV